VGQAAILAGARERRAAGTQGPGTHTRHVITTIAITVDGDTATGEAYYLFVVDTDKTPRVSGIGYYHDTFRRTATGWKLARRQITPG
jgi:3-phenylpropionate/cinnamic acid dioxygenase small subunit